MFVFLDTPFDRRHPTYSRLAAAEMLPDVVGPLAWSVMGPVLEEGFRVSSCDDLGLLPRPDAATPYRLTGRFAGRLHLNTAALHGSDRFPGSGGGVVDGTADLVEAGGDAEPRSDDRRHRLRVQASMGRTLAGIGRRVGRDRAAVDEARPDPTACDDLADAELVLAIRRNAVLAARVLGTHLSARALTPPILERATAALRRAGIGPEDSLRHLSRVPDLPTVVPATTLAELGATIRSGSALADVVSLGSWEQLSTSELVGAPGLSEAVRRFLDDHGHFGAPGYDPTVAAWAQDPDRVVRELATIRPVPVDPEPLDIDPGRVARPLVAAGRAAFARSGRTKDTLLRAVDIVRTPLLELERRLGGALGDDGFALCTLDELEAMTHGGARPTDTELARREAELEAARAVRPAAWSDGELRLDAQEANDDIGFPLVGVGASPGTASGRARHVRGPGDRIEPGEVVVATSPDLAWSPLLLSAAAVVTDLGGVLSHGAIVARELEVPAVAGTRHATAGLRDGDLVDVDADRGTVTVTRSP